MAYMIYAFQRRITHMKMSNRIKRQWRTKVMPSWQISWHYQMWYLQWELSDLLSLQLVEAFLRWRIVCLTLLQLNGISFVLYSRSIRIIVWRRKRSRVKKQKNYTKFIPFLFSLCNHRIPKLTCFVPQIAYLHSTFVSYRHFRQHHFPTIQPPDNE